MTDPRIEAAAQALNTEGWTCQEGSDEPGNYSECEDCTRACDDLARAALAAADKAATITTVEDLDALPVRSVILDECGESFQRLDMEGSAVWSSADLIASDLVELPARVIHWGTE